MKEDFEYTEVQEEIKNFIGRRYVPARDVKTATLLLTSKEICENLFEHFPTSEISIDFIFSAMKDLGFNYDTPENDMEFAWMMMKA